MANWYTFPITHGYISSYAGPNTDTPHYADDIGTPFHTPLTALWSGTVKQADYAAWGGEIFIQPDDPNIPEYYFYHPDRLEVSTGQHVTAGQEIALSGGENPGFPGAEHPAQPQWSTGPHTHVGFFSSWKDVGGGQGTRPFGPDITPFLTNLKVGAQILPPDTTGTNTADTATLNVAPITGFVQAGLVRAGLFLIAMLLIGFGLYMVFKKQIGQGVDTAKKAVEVAALA